MYMHGCLNTHDWKIICHILPVFVLSACNEILKQTVACKAFCRGGVTAFIQIVQFYPDAVHQLLRKLSGDISVFQILFIVRIHILVKASRWDGMTAGFQLNKLLNKPEGLTCLIKASRPLCRDTAAVKGNHLKLISSDRITAFSSHFFCQRRITLCIFHHCLTAQDHCI